MSIAPKFLSTPSGWRATAGRIAVVVYKGISIHALRVEGDRVAHRHITGDLISIHALRVEGDSCTVTEERNGAFISIHALRVEGDKICRGQQDRHTYFYPRPPGGGRPTTARFLTGPR